MPHSPVGNRTQKPGNNGKPIVNKVLKTIMDSHSMLNRATLAALLGYSHDGDRNIYTALGYDTSISFDQYRTQYARQDIARAVINRPINMTWQGPLEISEGDEEKETPLEQQYTQLAKRLRLKTQFKRLDKLSSIGEFGILLMGYSDVKSHQDWAMPVSGRALSLNYVKPHGQGTVEIKEWVERSDDPRYGLPLYYEVDMSNPNSKTTAPVKVHYSRVIHVTGELMESEVNGEPTLQVVWNRLKDLEKIAGGSAEMFWLGARPGYQFNVDPEAQFEQGDFEDLKNQLDEWEHGLRRALRTKGIDINALSAQVTDPSKHIDAIMSLISAVTGIPKRILMGSERGDLSSTQDRTEWLEKVQTRREEYAEEQIVRPFVDVCMERGVLPRTKEYDVVWMDLFAPSEQEKAEVGKTRAEALKAYGSVPGLSEIIPVEQFVDLFLGLPQEAVDKITEALSKMALEEQQTAATKEEEDELDTEPPTEGEDEE